MTRADCEWLEDALAGKALLLGQTFASSSLTRPATTPVRVLRTLQAASGHAHGRVLALLANLVDRVGGQGRPWL